MSLVPWNPLPVLRGAVNNVLDVPSWEAADGVLGGLGGALTRALPIAQAGYLGWKLGTPVGKFLANAFDTNKASNLPYYSVGPDGKPVQVSTGSYGGPGMAMPGTTLGPATPAPPARAITPKSAGRTVSKPKTPSRSGSSAASPSVASPVSQPSSVGASIPMPSQVANDFASYISTLNTAPLYQGDVQYSEGLGRYTRPSDYASAPTYQSPEQYQADVARMTANVANDPSQRSQYGPLGLSSYNLVPTYSGVRGVTFDASGNPVYNGPTTYRSSADAYRIATMNATAAQLADPAYRAVLESFAREGGLIGPSAEEQALLRARIDAQVAAAQQAGQQAQQQMTQWNAGNTGLTNVNAFMGYDAAGNPILANDPQGAAKIRQALVQQLGGGYDPYANQYEQQAMAQGWGNQGGMLGAYI